MHRADQLQSDGETHFPGDHADAVELALVIAGIAAGHAGSKILYRTRQVERALVDQRVEQFGPASQLLRQRRRERENIDQLFEQGRTRFDESEQVDDRGRIGEDIFPSQQRAVRLVGACQRLQQGREHRVESLERCRRAQRPVSPVTPSLDPFRQAFGIGKLQFGQPLRQLGVTA